MCCGIDIFIIGGEEMKRHCDGARKRCVRLIRLLQCNNKVHGKVSDCTELMYAIEAIVD